METDLINQPSDPGFTIRSDDQGFKLRQKNLFDQLETAELNSTCLLKQENSSDIKREIINNTHQINIPKRTIKKHFRIKESIFKRPPAPISKCLPMRSVPDYLKNPRKWKKYSLEDVSLDDMSNRTNTAAALSFLREIEDRKDKSQEEMMETEEPIKITFKHKKTGITTKPVFKVSALVPTEDDANNEKPSFKSSKLVMPEYVVGQKVKQEKKTKISKSSEKRMELKLDHLLENDEDE